jgi:Na+-translocating ferredoxin:NAD+ oxidoreductase RnfD subunit
MTRRFWLSLGPALLVAFGILAGTLAAKFTAGFGWWVITGPVLLAVSVVCADLFQARLRGKPLIPSLAALMIAAAFLAAGVILALYNPESMPLIIPVIGAACSVAIRSRSNSDPRVRGHP